MKLTPIALTAVSLVALTTTSFAKKSKSAPEPPAPSASSLIAKYDKNGDSKLDEAELSAYLKDLADSHPTGKKKHKK